MNFTNLNGGIYPVWELGGLQLKGLLMARKPNYDFEKRQKELAKKAKKEEKKKRKLAESEEISSDIPAED